MTDDRFRLRYASMDDMQRALITDIKEQGMELESLIDRVSDEYNVRCAHIAMTKLEETIMWAVKGASVAARGRADDH